ncbi:right-handed parallel beta-helix repeat-containing protein [Paenibacillus silvisoli]|uniref:right-handed parallel beta-helix repeat-containing protein n=1 Tax=Paenibacillus silvisoli TaxID=3110539 RepID=UPI002806416C|nr:right-handed parallel beta-helix repeat-containing protein [Paenibacillus silvisoli]
MMKRTAACFISMLIAITGVFGFGGSIAFAVSSYYVSPSGSDSNPGTLAQPFKTVQKGIDSMSAGDTLYLRAGTYQEKVYITNKNGSSSAWYTVKNYAGETPVMDGNNLALAEAFDIYNSSYWHIEGLEMKKYWGAGVYMEGYQRPGEMSPHPVSHIELIKLTIHDLDNPDTTTTAGTQAIAGEGPDFVTIKKCNIYNIGLLRDSPLDHGVYVGYGADHYVIDGNSMQLTSGSGLQLYGQPGGGSDFVITNNILWNNHKFGLIVASNTSNNLIANNTFYGNGKADVYMTDSASGNTFKNNIFGSAVGEYHVEMMDSGSASGNAFDYNLYYNSSAAAYRISSGMSYATWQSTYGQEAHGRTGDPLFINPAYSNLRVGGLSPALGVADASAAPTYDYDGNLREAPYHDMGAYDYNLNYDNFEGQSPNEGQYTTFDGSWRKTTDGSTVYEQYGATGYGIKALIGDPAWTNYDVQAKVKVVGGSGSGAAAGVIGRATSTLSSYYVAIIQPSQVVLYKIVSGNWTLLGSYSASYPVSTWYTLKLTCNGSNIAVSVDGTQRISVTDSSIAAGKAGFYTEYYARWDEFKVAPR